MQAGKAELKTARIPIAQSSPHQVISLVVMFIDPDRRTGKKTKSEPLCQIGPGADTVQLLSRHTFKNKEPPQLHVAVGFWEMVRKVCIAEVTIKLPFPSAPVCEIGSPPSVEI